MLKSALPQPVRDCLHWLKGLYVTRDVPRNQVFHLLPEHHDAGGDLAIVIPVHDATKVTRRCLKSVQRYAPQSEVILVDDASELRVTKRLIRDFSIRNNWKVIRHQKALGHSAACRDGAALATRDFICLLNSDTVITPWCWRLIREKFNSDPTIGTAGPSTSLSGNSQELESTRDLRYYFSDNQICVIANRLLSETDTVTNLPWVSGFAFFIRRRLWQQSGGFDENLPDYGNEKDLCLRITQMGYWNAWVHRAYIHHLGRQSYAATIGSAGIQNQLTTSDKYIERKQLLVSRD